MAKILIIDDDDDLREMLVTVLEDEGFAALAAEDGVSGLRMFSAARPDVIVTDMIMPEANGLDTIREILSIDSQARIIAMSGGSLAGSDYYLIVAKTLGAMYVLPKPFEPDELMQVIKTCLGSSPTRDASAA